MRIGRRLAAGTFLSASCLVLAVATSAYGASDGAAPRELAGQILEAAGVEGGLVVHVGCRDGRLTAALGAGNRFLVHGLDTDEQNVRQAREHVRELGVYGPVSIERFDGEHLPYADNLVNLVVAEDLDGVAMDEALRVLAPGGIAYVEQDGRWQKTVKPCPGNTDEWTHYLHDASGNPVAHDEVVGPPRRVQWIAGPRHTRSHEHIPSIDAVVSAGGRIFYIIDEAPTGFIRQASAWQLVARDAYNGLPLWQRPIPAWFPHLVNWGRTPNQLERKLVAVGDRVYVTLGIHAPLAALDARTGDALRVYEGTEGTEEIVYLDGLLLAVVRSVTDERKAELATFTRLMAKKGSPLEERESAQPLVSRLRASDARADVAIAAVEADTGRMRWKKSGPDTEGLKTLSLCAADGRAFYQKGNEAVCLDLATGRELWRASAGPLHLVGDGRVICGGGETIRALSAETGEVLWTQPAVLCQVRDVFLAGGSLWLGGFKPWEGRSSGKRGPAWGPYFAVQRDPATGDVLGQVEPECPGHHHRCYLNKATDRYILSGRRGVEFINLETKDVLWHSWVRGVCRYGVMPSNGLLYAPPHACGCYIAAKLEGFYALAPESDGERGARGEEGQRLEQGPAYGSPTTHHSSPTTSSDWPTYRHDALRSGATEAAVPARLRRLWQADLGGKLTSPTVAGGKLFVASVDDDRVLAIDADSGGPAWQFTAGSRVDSPPTVHEGRAIFGCRDGYVYSVRAADGQLAWRLHAARADRRIVAERRLESISPVPGGVLVRDGEVWLTAGRSSYLDGGIDLLRVEPATGKVLSRTPIYSPDPETGKQPPQEGPATMPGALEDVLSGDGDHVYLRDMVFNAEGAVQPQGDPHLFTLTGFLDDTWAHRSYWIFGTHCSLSTGCSGRDKNLLYGRLLVVDGPTVYGYGRASVHWSNQLEDGPYRLFAVDRGDGSRPWTRPVPITVRATLLAGDVLWAAGPLADADRTPLVKSDGEGSLLLAFSAADGSELARYPLDAPPVFDGMAAAGGRLAIALEGGRLVWMGAAGE